MLLTLFSFISAFVSYQAVNFHFFFSVSFFSCMIVWLHSENDDDSSSFKQKAEHKKNGKSFPLRDVKNSWGKKLKRDENNLKQLKKISRSQNTFVGLQLSLTLLLRFFLSFYFYKRKIGRVLSLQKLLDL